METTYKTTTGRSSESDSSVKIMQMGSINITDLPWEVLGEIFHHVDGKSLLICKRVCKGWRDHVRHLEQKANFWYDNCQKEIPSWMQFDLLDNMFPSHWKDQRQVNWEEIYKCWSVWNTVYGAPVTIHRPEGLSGLNGISSIKVSGEWLLISSCEGRGAVYAHRLTKDEEVIDFYVGGGAVLDFELVITDKPPAGCKYNSPSLANVDGIFDTLKHDEIWLKLKHCYIQAGRNYIHTLDRIQQQVSHSYGYEVRLVSDHRNSSIILKKTCSKVSGPELMELQLSNTYSEIVNFWINKITLSAIKLDDKLNVDTVSVNHRTQETSFSNSLGCSLEGETYEVYSWQGSLLVVNTDKRRVIIHYNGKEETQVSSINMDSVISVLFYAGYFFVGTYRGKLFIYKVKRPEDCLKIKVFETPCWEIEVCQDVIIKIAIAEPIHHKRKGPVIICATLEDVYFVSIPA